MADDEAKKIGASRKEAIEQGLNRYFGRPCTHGHGTVREVWGRHCAKCTQIAHERLREEYADRKRELERLRYAKDPSRHIKKVQAYYAVNGEAVREKRNKLHYKNQADEEYRKNNANRARQWKLDNPDKATRNAKVSKHRRRSLEQNASGSFSADDVAEIVKSQRGKCAYCRTKVGSKYHLDHIVALARGGTNDRRNLQALCPTCNLAKAARDPIDHARSLGMLL